MRSIQHREQDQTLTEDQLHAIIDAFDECVATGTMKIESDHFEIHRTDNRSLAVLAVSFPFKVERIPLGWDHAQHLEKFALFTAEPKFSANQFNKYSLPDQIKECGRTIRIKTFIQPPFNLNDLDNVNRAAWEAEMFSPSKWGWVQQEWHRQRVFIGKELKAYFYTEDRWI